MNLLVAFMLLKVVFDIYLASKGVATEFHICLAFIDGMLAGYYFSIAYSYYVEEKEDKKRKEIYDKYF